MLTFAYWLAIGYAAAVLLSSGVAHLTGIGRFRRTIEAHRVLGPGPAVAVAVGVVMFELVAGALVLMSAAGTSPTGIQITLAVCLAAGVIFTLYVRRLLRGSARAASCGCSPLGGPLTAASLIPGVLLAAFAGIGLAAALSHAGRTLMLDDMRGPAGIYWGLVLAVLVMLLPASAPVAEPGEAAP